MIYINARFLTQNITGVQRFAIEISKSLSKKRHDIIFLVPSLDFVIDKSFLNEFNIREIKGGAGHFWEQFTLPKYLKSLDNPLLINLCNTAPIFYKNKISTIHDVTFLRYPESYSFKFRIFYNFLVPMVIKSSEKLLTVSKFSKDDISKEYNLDKNKINVIYNAVSDIFYPPAKIKSEKTYALAVSSPNKHKNFPNLINAFLKSNVNLDLKIIGSLSNAFNDQISFVSNDPRIKFLGRVSDKELIELYQNAKFFIFPSLYEGFGIPPLEAQACGCPVISSNAASLPEVLEESAFYFEPNDINAIKSAIELVNLDTVLMGKLVIDGYENIKRFSWDKSAQKLNEIIDQVLSQ
ncbi:glycosyltransferase family 1 protein [uncultured Acinetobacter sp.]|uniref:glycosyltransferase family 4 protein n=1 Tax=uncultured Acinetobacter sp. TaxID=165433 RepID=UPI002586E1D3|nr:glycosyltransferase family 1 protein [uncultured Acinetobacter sp.]